MKVCPLCGSEANKRFDLAHTSVWACGSDECRLQFANPQLDEQMLARAYAKYYYPPDESIGGAMYENTPEEILRQTFGNSAPESALSRERLFSISDAVLGNCV